MLRLRTESSLVGAIKTETIYLDMVRALISVQLNVIRSITPSKVVEDASLGHTAVAVVGLVVHHQLTVDEVEAVGSARK